MDESWRMRIGTATTTTKQPHRKSSETLEPEDFDDVFGGPPRSVLSRQFSVEDDFAKTMFDDIFGKQDRSDRKLPEFRIPVSGGGGRRRCEEEFYSDIFRNERRSRTRSNKSVTNSNSKSKSNSSSILSSEEFTPFRPEVGDDGNDDVLFSSFASKLRPINVSCKWNTSEKMHQMADGQPHSPCNSHSPVKNQDKYETDYIHKIKGCYSGFSQLVSSPEIINFGPNSYASVKESIEDLQLNSPASIVSSLNHEDEACTIHEDDEEEEDEVMSSYVIEINLGNRERIDETVGIDDAIAWAKQSCQTRASEKEWNISEAEELKCHGVEDMPSVSKVPEVQESPELDKRKECIKEEPVKQPEQDLSPCKQMELELLDEDVKLWSDGKELNIRLLLSTLHHDIKTGRIIGRGTEKHGLYYVDEVTQSGTVMLAHGTMERKAWLWHRRLGHPSGSYLHTLFPELFPLNKSISCETCILAKSHRQPFKQKNTRVDTPLEIKDTSATQDDLPHLISEVNNSEPSEPQTIIPPLESVESVESIEPEQQETEEARNQEPLDQEQPTQYTLPARANRGVPAKRYSPEQFSRGSRYPMANIANGCLTTEAKAFSASLYSEKIPSSTEEALDSENWKGAMDEEMDALRKNETWEKCSLPTGKKPVGCRWIFTVKYKPDGKIDRYKARLVAKGYTQTYGIDYSETFSPVAKIDTIRVLFSIASNQGWPLHQFDVKNAFLHGDLKEEVYMEAPPGFSDSFKIGEVCRLKKSLYGLKQSPRAWFGRFTLAMKKYGFKQSNSDHTLFLKHRQGYVTCLIIYVDDMIITGNDEQEIKKLKEGLFTEFEMKDLGRLKYFLGIEVLRSQHGIFICQKKYILDLLTETGMLDCKPAETPMIANQKLYIEPEGEPTDKGRYQRMVGKLIYLSHTRPDIAYAVGVVSQFMHQPQKAHMDAVERIIEYLKGTPGYGVLFKSNGHLNVQIYTDADWAGDKGNRRSTSGYFSLVGGNLVTWRSKKQRVVSLSSAEAEYRGISRGVAEVLWIRKLLTEVGFCPKGATQVFCDNKAAIQISENPVQHDRTKHVEIDRHFIKEKLEAGIIELPFVRSEDQLADILTKAVRTGIMQDCLGKLNFGDPTMST